MHSNLQKTGWSDLRAKIHMSVNTQKSGNEKHWGVYLSVGQLI